MKSSTKRLNKGDVTNAILATVKIAGFITMVALAPKTIQLLESSTKGRRLADKRYYLKTVVGKLHQQGLIEFRENGETQYIVLSEKGEKRLARHQELGLKRGRREKWDGKWRIVIFDIKESTRVLRDKLRLELTNIGFVRIQNSVWAFPYDCEEFIFLLKIDFELGRGVLYMTVEKLENDKWLRKIFSLPL